jgi:hypothetical protein
MAEIRFVLLETVLRNVHQGEPNLQLFRLLNRALERLEKKELGERGGWLLLNLFLMRLAACLGFSLPTVDGPEGALGPLPTLYQAPLNFSEWECLLLLQQETLGKLQNRTFGAITLVNTAGFLLSHLAFHHGRNHLPRSWHHLVQVWETRQNL